MKLLTRIRLINWHYLTDFDLPIEGSMYLFGENESGKSSILDAIQFALVADLRRIRFNASARGGERTERTLEGYVRCQVGEKLYLRDSAVAYVALEFSSEKDTFVIGGIVESHADTHYQHGFFIFSHYNLDDSFFLDAQRRPYSLSQFRAKIRQASGCAYYPDAVEYHKDLLNRLGKLNRRFFDLFVKAFAFKPETNIRKFIEEYILDRDQVDIETMRQTRERYEELSQLLQRVEKQLEALQQISEADEERSKAKRLLDLHDDVIQRAEHEQAKANLESNKHEQVALTAALNQLKLQLVAVENKAQQTQQELDETQRALNDNALYVQRQQWEKDRVRLLREINEAERQRKIILTQLQTKQRTLQGALRELGAVLLGLPAELVKAIENIKAFVLWLEGLPNNLEQARPRGLELFEAARESLGKLNEWCIDERARVKEESRRINEQLQQKDEELTRLKRERKPEPPRSARELQELLTAPLGEVPFYFYECLDIADEDELWQNAVEGILGFKRFDLLIKPAKFEECAKLYEQEREKRHIFGARLIDLSKIVADKKMMNLRPGPQSLALKVQVKPTTRKDIQVYIKTYINMLLGGWIACQNATEIRQHSQAVTPTCMTYSQYALDHLNPEFYKAWFIGQRAYEQRLKRLEAEKEELRQKYVELNTLWQTWDSRVKATKPTDNYTRWLDAWPELPNLAQLAEELADLKRKLEETDWSDIEALQIKVKQLHHQRDQLQQEIKHLAAQEGSKQSELKGVQAQEIEYQRQVDQRHERLKDFEAPHPPEQVAEWRARYQAVAQQHNFDFAKIIRNYTNTRAADETNLTKARDKIYGLQLQYNNSYSFYAPTEPDEVSAYHQERERLEQTELPQYRKEVEQARHNADIEFQEHFIHSMREKIRSAESQLAERNEALKHIDFSGTVYRFKAEPNPDVKSYYDLIIDQDSSTMGLPLLQGNFLEKHQDTLKELAGKLLGRGASQAEIDSLCDYRQYLVYDIELKREGERWERLSKVGGLQSGGKTQAPYYVVMVAAFAQLYRIQNVVNNDTARLVVFDEAFNRMDRLNTESALKLMKEYGLQVVTATPPKRFDEIAPFVKTTIYVERTGTQVRAVPYFYNSTEKT